ncbi:MAG: hypothetical protein LBS88_08160 [Tannerellaceae bacterium]|nr:hypothetical protein [Tannerellaceae bacterium]
MRGASQVGKTTAVEEFAKEFYIFLPLNLEQKADKAVFEANDTPADVMTAIYLLKNKEKKAGRTLLFLFRYRILLFVRPRSNSCPTWVEHVSDLGRTAV